MFPRAPEDRDHHGCFWKEEFIAERVKMGDLYAIELKVLEQAKETICLFGGYFLGPNWPGRAGH